MPNFRVSRRFAAKRTKCWNVSIIISTASIIILYCYRDPQVFSVGGPNMSQTNPRWQMAAILINQKILISSQNIAQFWQNLACWCVSTFWTQLANKILQFQKSKMESVAILKIREIAPYMQRKDPFWRHLAQGCVWSLQTPSANKISQI